MNRIKNTVMSVILLCTLTGCTNSSPKNNDETEYSKYVIQEETSQSTSDSQLEDMPLISIETVNQDNSVMDFITKPVARHVAEQIATWTPDYEMPPEPYYEACTITLTDSEKNVLLDNVSADVKVRGNWTTNYEKKPLRIKFTENQNMLGMNEGAEMKNWLLLAEYKDASMLRDKTALSIARELSKDDDLYVSDAKLVEVQVNQQYWGVYLLAEQQQVNKNRVDITEPKADETQTNIGYFLEFDGYFYNEEPLKQFHVDYADNAELIPFDGNGGSGRTMKCLPKKASDVKNDIGMTIKSDIYSQEQHDFIASYINNVYDIMYEAAYNDKAFVFNNDYTQISETDKISPQEAVKQAVDVQSLADIYIISELTCDADIYWSSFYMDVDFGTDEPPKLRFEAPWDFDSSMGLKNRCLGGEGFYASNIVPDVDGGPQGGGQYETVNPWLVVLAYEDWYQEIIKEKWTKAYDDGIFERAFEEIEHDKTSYLNSFEKNYKKWNNIENNMAFEMELSYPAKKCKTEAEAADFLSQWLHNRVDFLNSQWHT